MKEALTYKTPQKNYYKKLKVSQFDINWNSRFFQLKDFKKLFGHCNVPQNWPENKSLGRWVIRQRARKQKLSPERREELTKIGFSWNKHDLVWEQSFQELQSFKNIYGHCNVSRSFKEYKKLFDWVIKQRKDKRQNQNRLTEYKIAKLNEIGLDWGFSKPGWDNQYNELVNFHRNNGHCRITRNKKENSTLANWIIFQRVKKNALTPEQIEKLNSLGFIWSKHKKKPYPNNG